MAARSGRRKVTLSTAALESLREIWLWNAQRYGAPHANGYLRFLESAIEKLSRPEATGRPVPNRPNYRYLLIQRRSGSHGHIAVFQTDNGTVTILRIFHTSQDWQGSIDTRSSEPLIQSRTAFLLRAVATPRDRVILATKMTPVADLAGALSCAGQVRAQIS